MKFDTEVRSKGLSEPELGENPLTKNHFLFCRAKINLFLSILLSVTVCGRIWMKFGIRGVSGGRVNILGGGSMDYSE
jgi:hypothetical protein